MYAGVVYKMNTIIIDRVRKKAMMFPVVARTKQHIK